LPASCNRYTLEVTRFRGYFFRLLILGTVFWPLHIHKRIALTLILTPWLLSGCVINTPSAATRTVAAAMAGGLPSIDTAAAQRLLTADETLQTLNFAESGSQIVSGRIVGRRSPAYAVPLRAGQTLDVTMDTPSDSAYFNIQDVRDQSGAAVFAGETSNARYASVRASSDATYVIRPFLNRAVAGRGSQANYTLKIERH